MEKTIKENFKDISVRKIILVAITGSLVLMLSEIPYLNLLVGTQTLYFMVFILTLFVFNLNSKFILITFFSLLLYCLILILIGQTKEAQVWGDYSFPVLIIALIKYYLENRKEIVSSEQDNI